MIIAILKQREKRRVLSHTHMYIDIYMRGCEMYIHVCVCMRGNRGDTCACMCGGRACDMYAFMMCMCVCVCAYICTGIHMCAHANTHKLN